MLLELFVDEVEADEDGDGALLPPLGLGASASAGMMQQRDCAHMHWLQRHLMPCIALVEQRQGNRSREHEAGVHIIFVSIIYFNYAFVCLQPDDMSAVACAFATSISALQAESN